jgi:hypothetical protein
MDFKQYSVGRPLLGFNNGLFTPVDVARHCIELQQRSEPTA